MDTLDRHVQMAPDAATSALSAEMDSAEVIAQRIAAYQPNSVSQALWMQVADHVRDAVAAFQPASVSAAYLTMQAATRFAIWAAERGLPLEPELLYTEANVEFFVATGLPHLGEHSRASYRSSLRRIGRTITRRADWSPRPPRLKRRDLSSPYSDAEIAWLWDIARHQTNQSRLRSARALMCLAYGAGLRAPEYSAVSAHDVREVDGVWVIDVTGGPLRSVPVLPEAAEDLRWLLETAPEGPLFSPRKPIRNFTASVIAKIEVPPRAPRFVSRRLRITWMVRLSIAGLRISELGHLAGVKSTSTWEELGRFIPQRDESALRTLIGGLL